MDFPPMRMPTAALAAIRDGVLNSSTKGHEGHEVVVDP
jgi:hypothetical protein